MIKFKNLLIPFSTRNVCFRDDGVIGFTEYFIFGIRIAKIQKTQPWS